MIKVVKGLKEWILEEKGTALTEAVILFPVLLSLLMGVYDIGQGIVINQKTIAASQIIGDLVTRNKSVNQSLIDDIILAGEMALEPFSTDSMGYDIVSVRFDEDGNPEILWRVTENMDPNDDALNSAFGLGGEGDGVVVVSVVYNYHPYFSNFVVDEIKMEELSFLRGRTSPVVTCDDCS